MIGRGVRPIRLWPTFIPAVLRALTPNRVAATLSKSLVKTAITDTVATLTRETWRETVRYHVNRTISLFVVIRRIRMEPCMRVFRLAILLICILIPIVFIVARLPLAEMVFAISARIAMMAIARAETDAVLSARLKEVPEPVATVSLMWFPAHIGKSVMTGIKTTAMDVRRFA